MKTNLTFSTIYAKICLLFLTALLISGCKERHNKTIDLAYQLTSTTPDSALTLLDGVKKSRLCRAEEARYALVYTIAQDKSGLDVDNDSLLKAAYTYYNYRPTDSLYAKCEYYMGKYYLLNDSIEVAVGCLKKSITATENQNDNYTLTLALAQLSKALENIEPSKAVFVAKRAEIIYQDLPNASKQNIVYYKLNVSEASVLAGNLKLALEKCNEAMTLALQLGDSTLLSDVYQDMSTIFSKKKEYQQALSYSKKSFELSKTNDISKLLNLSWAYLDADSLKECKSLLENTVISKPSSLYTAYYIRHIVAIKMHDYDNAIVYADSAYHYIEKMYSDELWSKKEYYNSFVKSQYDKGVSEGKSTLYGWIIIIVVLSAILTIILILYSYKQYRINANYKMQSALKEREAERKIHEEEIRHKEIQLSTMRGYVLKKVRMAQKIEQLKGNKNKNVALTSKDWDEIRLFINSVEDDFATRLKKQYPELTEDDIKFFTLIRLRMPAKALGLIYNISEKSIRQKLFIYKSKVGLDSSKNISLRTFIENF